MGTAIVVKDVNWGANSVGKVTVPEVIVKAATDIYTEYIQATGRAESKPLLSLINELIINGFKDKITTMYYFASEVNDVNQITTNIFNPKQTLGSGGSFDITKEGVRSLQDGYFRDIPFFLNAGVTVGLLISKAGHAYTGACEWGGYEGYTGNKIHFSSTNGIIIDSQYGQILRDKDSTVPKGAFTFSADDEYIRYNHNGVYAEQASKIKFPVGAQFNPHILRTQHPYVYANCILKLSIMMNTKLKKEELATLHSILMKYENLI